MSLWGVAQSFVLMNYFQNIFHMGEYVWILMIQMYYKKDF